MLLDEHTDTEGRTSRSYIIGHFAVTGCCGPYHSVDHIPSKTRLVCGLSVEEALQAADIISLYAEHEPSSTNVSDMLMQLGTLGRIWFREQHKFKQHLRSLIRTHTKRGLHARQRKRVVKPPTPTDEDNALFESLRTRRW